MEGQTVKGKHPALISEELFLQVNNLLNKNAHGYKWNKEEEEIPLRRFLVFEECGKPFTGYSKKKKALMVMNTLTITISVEPMDVKLIEALLK